MATDFEAPLLQLEVGVDQFQFLPQRDQLLVAHGQDIAEQVAEVLDVIARNGLPAS